MNLESPVKVLNDFVDFKGDDKGDVVFASLTIPVISPDTFIDQFSFVREWSAPIAVKGTGFLFYRKITTVEKILFLLSLSQRSYIWDRDWGIIRA